MFETKQAPASSLAQGACATWRSRRLSERPEVLFVLANHYPPSTILARELKKLPPREHADYRVATVTYAGYALFKENVSSA